MLDEAQKDLPLMTGVAADTETEEARKMIERQAIGDLAHHLLQGTLNEFLTLVSIWRKNKNITLLYFKVFYVENFTFIRENDRDRGYDRGGSDRRGDRDGTRGFDRYEPPRDRNSYDRGTNGDKIMIYYSKI